jgi:hypothetical protein
MFYWGSFFGPATSAVKVTFCPDHSEFAEFFIPILRPICMRRARNFDVRLDGGQPLGNNPIAQSKSEAAPWLGCEICPPNCGRMQRWWPEALISP